MIPEESRESDYPKENESNSLLIKRSKDGDQFQKGKDLFLADEGNPNSYYIDRIYKSVGYTAHQWIIISITFLILSVQGLHLFFMTVLLETFKQLFRLTQSQTQMLGLTIFFGIEFGSLSLIVLNKYVKRTNIIKGSSILITSVLILWSCFESYIASQISLFFIGACIGTMTPIANSILCEYLPHYLREFYLTAVWIGISFGQIIVILNISILSPRLNPEQLQKLIMSLIPFHVLITGYCTLFLRDSPRNLLITGQSEEAIRILESMLKRNLSEDECEVLRNENKEIIVPKSFMSLYYSVFFDRTLNICAIGLFTALLLYGPVLVITLEDGGISNGSLNEMMIMILFYCSSVILGSILCTITQIGSKKTSVISGIIGLIASILLVCITTNKQLVLTGFIIFAASLLISVFSTYILELYPTEHRDIAVSLFYSSLGLGGILSQFLFTFLYVSSKTLPHLFYLAFNVGLIVFMTFLPSKSEKL